MSQPEVERQDVDVRDDGRCPTSHPLVAKAGRAGGGRGLG